MEAVAALAAVALILLLIGFVFWAVSPADTLG